MAKPKVEVAHADRFLDAKAAEVPELYFNGFAIGMTSGDANIVLERNGSPIAILNMSFTLAKTLALSMGSAVSAFEQIANQQLLTTHDVDQAYSDATEKEGNDVSSIQ